MADKVITVTLPEEVAAELVRCFTKVYGYQATINDEANPESPEAFTQRKFLEYGLEVVNAVKVDEAKAEAAAALAKVTGEGITIQ